MEEKRYLDEIPFDMGFWIDELHYELCHATGYEVKLYGEWWNEYIDRDGNLHYGR